MKLIILLISGAFLVGCGGTVYVEHERERPSLTGPGFGVEGPPPEQPDYVQPDQPSVVVHYGNY